MISRLSGYCLMAGYGAFAAVWLYIAGSRFLFGLEDAALNLWLVFNGWLAFVGFNGASLLLRLIHIIVFHNSNLQQYILLTAASLPCGLWILS